MSEETEQDTGQGKDAEQEQATEREQYEGTEQDESGSGARGGEEDDESAEEKAEAKADAREKAQERVKELEDDPPKDLEDWPDDEAKYITFGGGEGDHGYEEGPERKLGPSEVRHHEDGTITVAGEEVDDPDEYKGEPIPGGPTDPNAPDGPEKKLREKKKDTGDGSEDDDAAQEDGDSGSKDGPRAERGSSGEDRS